MLQGVNVEVTVSLSNNVRIPVIASGGIGSMADIEALVAAKAPNILGLVIGRALYDGRIDPTQALAQVSHG